MKILVTGAAGYIGSHTCIELMKEGYEVVAVDNFYNSKKEAIHRIEKITGGSLTFFELDILDEEKLKVVFEENKIDGVIHFAGYKAVGESVSKPLDYYYNNITGTLVLCKVMSKYNVKNLVFSSSATVYGLNNPSPLQEDMPLSSNSPYGRTKLMIEEILRDLYVSDKEWRISLLRYFNPAGAHESGQLGEDPNGIPNNLMPFVSQVAVGRLPQLKIFGGDYDTPDGTGVRDYIHVVDLALGHISALSYVFDHPGLEAFNLGTGEGQSVLDVVKAFEKASGVTIPYEIVARRPGDVATCYADVTRAHEILGWQAKKSMDEICIDTWRWQKNNPQGL